MAHHTFPAKRHQHRARPPAAAGPSRGMGLVHFVDAPAGRSRQHQMLGLTAEWARIRHVSDTRRSPFPGNGFLRAETQLRIGAANKLLRRLRDQARAQDPANSGLFTRFQEISAIRGLPGGPERTRTACQPRSHIELVSEKARTAKLVGLEPVSGSTT